MENTIDASDVYLSDDEGSNEENEIDTEAETKRSLEIQADDDEYNFCCWMNSQGLRLPLERWNKSSLELCSVLSVGCADNYRKAVAKVEFDRKPLVNCSGKYSLPVYRLELLLEAAEYYSELRGGDVDSILACMIIHFK